MKFHASLPPPLILRFKSGSILPSGCHSASLGDISPTGRARPAKPGIAVEQAAFGAGRIEFSHLIARFCPILENLVPVRKPLRYIEGPVIVCAKLDGDMAQVSRALRAQVDDYVEDRAASTPHEFGFGGGGY